MYTSPILYLLPWCTAFKKMHKTVTKDVLDLLPCRYLSKPKGPTEEAFLSLQCRTIPQSKLFLAKIFTERKKCTFTYTM